MENHVRWTMKKEIETLVGLELDVERSPWSAETITKYLETKKVVSMVVTDAQQKVIGYILYALEPVHFVVYRLAAENGEIAFILLHKVITRLSQHRREKLYVLFDDHQLDAAIADAIKNFAAYDPAFQIEDMKTFTVISHKDKHIAFYPSYATPDEELLQELIKEPWEDE